MEAKKLESKKNYMEEILATLTGSLGVYYENLVTGETVLVTKKAEGNVASDEGPHASSAGDTFESASVIKLWIMSCAYEAFEFWRNGERENPDAIDPGMKVVLKDSDRVPAGGILDYRADQLAGRLTTDMFPESGILNYLEPGLELTVKDLVKLMIIISDNTATNMMIDILGIDRINSHIEKLHGKNNGTPVMTALKRKLFDSRPEVRGRENSFSLREAGEYFRLLYEGKLVSAAASKEMCAILQNQQTTYKIPFFIQNLPIAHKTGEDIGIANDVGIVFAEEPFILCFASNGVYEPDAVRACQDIARFLVSSARN